MNTKKRPYFLWDYNLSEEDVHRILKTGTETDKIWMMSRILESATYEDVWKYLTFGQIKTMFPKLKLKKPIKKAWEYAFAVWSGQ